ncbi:hypothetical protein KA017_00610 [Candidatus Woesebacteria bacterium]|nr:hypothetical protein [Candidatus Woesebacteria bacterium]
MQTTNLLEQLGQPIDTEPRQKLSEVPEIVQILESITDAKFGLMNQIAHYVALQIFDQFKKAGLYSKAGDGTFINKGKAEVLVAGSDMHNLTQEFFALSRVLSSARLAPRGTVLLNTLSVYLGIAIVEDPYLRNMESRRRLLLESFNLYQLPVGLYKPGTETKGTADTVPTDVLFDMQEIQASIFSFRKHSKVKVDVIAYNALVNRLERLLRIHKRDRVVQDWCEHKLKELEIFGQGLADRMQSFAPNKRNLHRWQK